MMKQQKKILTALAAALMVLTLAACGSEPAPASASGSGSSAEPVTVKIGVVGENNEQWTPVIDAMAKENVTVELVTFADYTLPNQALADGEIDLRPLLG